MTELLLWTSLLKAVPLIVKPSAEISAAGVASLPVSLSMLTTWHNGSIGRVLLKIDNHFASATDSSKLLMISFLIVNATATELANNFVRSNVLLSDFSTEFAAIETSVFNFDDASDP
jgi:hypothetical protein